MKQLLMFLILITVFTAGVLAQNVGIGINSPEAKLDVRGPVLFRGSNVNFYFSPFSKPAVEFYFGRGATGAKPSGVTEADLAFNWGGPGSGFRHYISTRHDVNQYSPGNAIDFYINNAFDQYGSLSPDTGNIRMLSITANGVKIPGSNTLEFGEGSSGKSPETGRIGYKVFSADALDFVGAGTDSTDRKLKFWNEGGASFTGNVGIGMNHPNAPLQFNNLLVSRKIVLWDMKNNDHNYLGFGVNGGMLRYQVGVVDDSHVFFAGVNDSTSAELMRITGRGKLGLGTSSPGAKGLTSSRFEIADENGSNSDMQMRVAGPGYAVINLIKSKGTLNTPLPVEPGQFTGIFQSGYYADSTFRTSASISFASGSAAGNGKASGKMIFTTTDTSANRGTNVFVMNEFGNLGIGTSNPAAKLHVAGNLKIDSTYTLEFGAGLSKEENAGKIGYSVFTPNALDIVGGGHVQLSRKIKFWAEGGAEFIGNVTVNGNLDVVSIQPEVVINPILSNSWVNYGSGYADAGYWKDKEGVVHLQGLIKSGITSTGTLLFQLPVGYRPSGGRLIFTADNAGVQGRVDVLADGQVLLMTATSNAFLNLTGITFRSN
ncbi:MAG: hypothetical protein IPP73_16540 [Chitinophagaceae bacterium]|nr:hypothetical protein [Chitinophagaceae bacterium]